MGMRIVYHYTCEHCGKQGESHDQHGVIPGWVQLGISGSGEPSPFLCGWACLLHVVAKHMASEPLDHGHTH